MNIFREYKNSELSQAETGQPRGLLARELNIHDRQPVPLPVGAPTHPMSHVHLLPGSPSPSLCSPSLASTSTQHLLQILPDLPVAEVNGMVEEYRVIDSTEDIRGLRGDPQFALGPEREDECGEGVLLLVGGGGGHLADEDGVAADLFGELLREGLVVEVGAVLPGVLFGGLVRLELGGSLEVPVCSIVVASAPELPGS